MHELAICQAIVNQVEVLANERSATSVSEIHIAVGPLSGVEPALLRNAFPIATAGTIASGATLHIEDMGVRVRCVECEVESEAKVNRLLCGECGGWKTQLISGDELLLLRVELERPEQSPHQQNSLAGGPNCNV